MLEPHRGGNLADPEILDAELHPDARLRYIQRRLQEEEGLRLTIDNIAYVLRLADEFAEAPAD